jgi:hypothetical protein
VSNRIAPEWLHSAPILVLHAHRIGLARPGHSPPCGCRPTGLRSISGDCRVADPSQRGPTPSFAVDGLERGSIRPEGILRVLRFVMRREGTTVWVLTVRSFVRQRHRLQMVDGDVVDVRHAVLLVAAFGRHRQRPRTIIGASRDDEETLGVLRRSRQRHGRPPGRCRVHAFEVVLLVDWRSAQPAPNCFTGTADSCT